MESSSPTPPAARTDESSATWLAPWLSAIASLVVIGLPHVYYGRWRRAIGFWVACAAAGTLAIYALRRAPLSVFVGLVLVEWSFYVWVAIDAARVSRNAAHATVSPAGTRRLEATVFLVASLTVSALISVPLRRAGVNAYRIPTGTMAPTILAGDYIFVLPTDSTHVTRGSLVTYRMVRDSTLMALKRVVAIGEDTIAMQHGQLILNRTPVREAYIQMLASMPGSPEDFTWQREYVTPPLHPGDPYYHPTADDWGPLVVPPGHVFVLGDNRHDSMDSRYAGFLPTRNITGSATRIYFSRDPESGHVRWKRIGKSLR